MEQIDFIGLDDVLDLHAHQIEKYGGSLGVRDLGLLKSAVAMPSATFGGEYLHVDVYEMAAAYLFHIVQNHPFIDGNKRAGAVVALAFLAINAIRVDDVEDELETLVMDVACGKIDKPEIAEFLRDHSSPMAS
jgi:death-on-curing protein